MKFRNVFLISGIGMIALLLILFLFPILPCRTVPIPINSEHSWSLCSLSSLKSNEFQTENIYILGIFQNILLIISSLGILFLILSSVLISKLFRSKK